MPYGRSKSMHFDGTCDSVGLPARADGGHRCDRHAVGLGEIDLPFLCAETVFRKCMSACW